jgi:phage regulator Rha-like protein
MNEELVILKQDDVFTTSEIIADGTGSNYRSVQRLIEKYQDDLKEFGRVRFEITPLQTKGGIQNKKIYLLNEQQTTLLMTYMKNTPVVREFKKALVKEFYEMRKFIMERHTDEWVESRKLSKLNRKAETDAVKELVEYAQANGSKNATRYYTIYSKLANKVVGITNRDEAHISQLNTLSVVENVMKSTIHECIVQGMDYHDIYKECQKRLSVFTVCLV